MLPLLLLAAASGTPLVVTSTVFSSTVYAPAPALIVPHSKVEPTPRRPAPTLSPPSIELPRTWGGQRLLLGLHLEYSMFRSKAVSQEMSASPASQVPVRSALIDETVLLMGLGATAELRPLPYLGLVPFVSYLFTPRFFSVSVESDGKVETKIAYAHAVVPGALARLYLPVSRHFDLLAGGGAAMYFASFRDHHGSRLGFLANLGFQLSGPDIPDSRLMAFVRYAPIEATDAFNLNLTGAGVLADIVFGVL